MKESDMLKKILLKMQDYVLFRNNVGLFYTGKEVFAAKQAGRFPVIPGDIVLRGARRVKAGLEVGSSDLIGFHPATITPEMVGDTVAVFTAVEAKTKGIRVTDEQRRFCEAVESAGGEAFVIWEDEL